MKSRIKNHPLHYSIYTRACARDIFYLLSLKSNIRLLDVGCGIGYFIERINQKYENLNIHGIEYDLNSIIYLSKRVSGNFINGDATKLPYNDNSFDRVLSVSVLEHLKEDEKMIKEMVRVCKNEGEIIISVPSKEGLRSYTKLRNLGHTDPENKEYHYRIGYSKKELTVLLENNGVKVMDSYYSLILSAEIAMDIVKILYFRNNNLKSQTNIVEIEDSMIFRVYKMLFPFVLLADYIEKMTLRRWLKGHIITVRGKVLKFK